MINKESADSEFLDFLARFEFPGSPEFAVDFSLNLVVI